MESEAVSKFLREVYYNDLIGAARDEKPLIIDFNDLDRFNPLLSEQLLEDSERILKFFKEAVQATEIPIDTDYKVNIRFKNIPETRNIRIRDLRAKHLSRMWSIECTVKAASEVKPQIYEVVFKCPDCAAKIRVEQDSNLIQKPYICECGRRGDFEQLEKKMFDMRWLQVIEPFEVTSGEQPGQIAIFLKEDLTTPKMQRKTDPGARLHIVGLLKELPKRIKGKLSTKMDMYIEANLVETSDIDFEDIEVTKEDEIRIRELAADPDIYEKLKLSIAPGIYGFDEIKEAIAMQLFGGVVHRLADGTRIRGNIHILLTGDPGVGKSAILKLVSSVVPRSRYVSGSGVSGAGLTATVVKNEAIGGWVLEAGALILCNRGLIAIDEFDKIGRDDQVAMHEATSVETVSIAKASIVATLPAQTAVLAGANPKLGRFDPYLPIVDQISIPETLLSRFDLKFALRDIPDRAEDERIASHIIGSRTTPESAEPLIDRMLLRKYISYAKRIQSLELLPEAANMLKDFYVDMRNRQSGGEKSVAITLRQYEALIRLAEASAKIRMDTAVRVADAERSIRLMKFSLVQLGMDQDTGMFDIDRLESGITSSKRKKITQIIEIINNLQQHGREVSIEDVKAEAETLGIAQDIDAVIDELKRNGSIFEPKPGFVRKI